MAIEYYEGALRLLSSEALQSRSNVLNRLDRTCFELGAAYLEDRDELESIYERGKDYALASIRLDPAFFQEAETESFRSALAGASDVEAIFWYGNVFGRYVEFHPLTAMMGGMSDIKTSFERAIELDPGYLAGGPWRAYASFLAQVPGFLGGDRQAARAAHVQAIDLGPTYLENLVNAADFVAKPDGDWDSFCGWLQQAVEQGADPGVMAEVAPSQHTGATPGQRASDEPTVPLSVIISESRFREICLPHRRANAKMRANFRAMGEPHGRTF